MGFMAVAAQHDTWATIDTRNGMVVIPADCVDREACEAGDYESCGDNTALQLHVTARRIDLMERMSSFACIPNGPEAYAQLVSLIQAKRAQPRESESVGYGINR